MSEQHFEYHLFISRRSTIKELGDLFTTKLRQVGYQVAYPTLEPEFETLTFQAQIDLIKTRIARSHHHLFILNSPVAKGDPLLIGNELKQAIALHGAENLLVIRVGNFNLDHKLRTAKILQLDHTLNLDEMVDRSLQWLSGFIDHTAAANERADISANSTTAGAEKVGIRAIAFGPTGHLLAAACTDGTVRCWNISTGTVDVFGGHKASVNSVAFSPDGKLLASGSDDHTIRVLNLDSNYSAVFSDHEDLVRCVTFSPDSRSLASGSDDKKVLILDLETGISRSLPGHTGVVWSVLFSPDGKQLASASSSDDSIRIWNLETYSSRILDGAAVMVSSMAFSPDGTRLATSSLDAAICIREIDGSGKYFLHGHIKMVLGVAFDPGGALLASGSSDNTVRVWDIAARSSFVLRGHSHPIMSVAFSPDGSLLASASFDGTIRVWSPKFEGESLAVIDLNNEIPQCFFQPVWIGKSNAAEADLAGSTDRLGYRRYASAFSDLIESPDSSLPLVIGIFGPWGLGKSTLLHYIKEELHSRQAFRKVSYSYAFAGWRWSLRWDDRLPSKTTQIFPPISESVKGQDLWADTGKVRQYARNMLNRAQRLNRPGLGLAFRLWTISQSKKQPLLFRLWLEDVSRALGNQTLFREAATSRTFAALRRAFVLRKGLFLRDGDVPNFANQSSFPLVPAINVVEFNAWEYSASPILWPALVRKLMRALLGNDLVRHWDWFRHYVARRARHWTQLHLAEMTIAALFAAIAIVIGVRPEVTAKLGSLSTGETKLLIAGLVGLVPSLYFLDFAYRIFSNPFSQGLGAFIKRPGYGGGDPTMEETRQDLEFLSGRLDRQHGRMVVLIDDLDRCEPDKAVEMLKAINLLLGFRPFVVILGVDARLITCAIEAHYKEVLGEAGSHGFEYLEKIIQIPFQIPYPSKEELEAFLSSQLGLKPGSSLVYDDSANPGINSVVRAAEDPSIGPAPPLFAPPSHDSDTSQSRDRYDEEDVVAAESHPGDLPATEAMKEPGIVPPQIVPITSLDHAFSKAERDALVRLSGYLKPNPRHIKRLINVYRLTRSLLQQAPGASGGLLATENLEIVLPGIARWLTLCSQWPYTVHHMLRQFDAAAVLSLSVSNPLSELAKRAQASPDFHPALQRRWDHSPEILSRLLSDEEEASAPFSLRTLKAVRPYTLHFNPAVTLPFEAKDEKPKTEPPPPEWPT